MAELGTQDPRALTLVPVSAAALARPTLLTSVVSKMHMPWLARYEPFSYVALRVVAGLLFSVHGMQKILGWFTDKPGPPFGSQLWLGGWIELVAGLLIALGLFTRPAAFLAAGTMAVAYFQFHWKLALAGSSWMPAVNKGELAVIYCFVFLFIATRGSGPWALDARLTKRV
jgi:putative oxidoreductase